MGFRPILRATLKREGGKNTLQNTVPFKFCRMSQEVALFLPPLDLGNAACDL